MASVCTLKVFLLSCLIAVLGFVAHQGLREATHGFHLKIFIPAKRSDVFKLLLNPEMLLKFHPLCTGISHIVKSHDDEGKQTINFEVKEHANMWGLYEKDLTFTVMGKVTQMDTIMENYAEPEGVLVLNQRWVLSDYTQDDENGTLLEDYLQLTGANILSRIGVIKGKEAHAKILKNFKQHFI